MNFPSTAAGLLVLLLAVIPGLPAGKVYDALVGIRWRETDFQQLLRLLAFSILGLVVYSICAGEWGWPEPTYVMPGTFTSPEFSVARLRFMGMAFLGHVAGASLVGIAAALGLKGLGAVFRISTERDAWDQFINFSAPEHWVLVTLRTGEIYAGKLHHADVSVGPEFRDIVLEEPALFDDDSGQYRTTWHQHLFINGSDVASMATVYAEEQDGEDRVSAPGESLFEGEDTDG